MFPTTTPMPKTVEKEPKNFEAAIAELDALVEKMDAGQLPLEESLEAYQRGTTLLRYCEKLLADAEQRIQVLAPGTGDAPASLRDLDPAA
jgi:exodeoxyribonuclease VII small subunit